MSNEVLTTAQAAEFLGISINTLRSWKSRKSDILLEGQHWVNSDNQVLWTQAGLEALQQLKTATPSIAPDAMDSIATSDEPLQEPIAEPSQPDLLKRYAPLVESVADAIAGGLLNRIDRAVSQKVRTAIATPMSPVECVAVLQELGLKPCNPELLLTGNIPNLLTESKE